MHKNPLWLIFLGLIFIVTLFYTATTTQSAYDYLQLNMQTPSLKTEWKVKKLKSDLFILVASYHYQVQDKSYQGKTIFNQNRHRNSWAAEQKLAEFSNKQFSVWYNSKKPTRSTLQKVFPTKKVISTVILWALLLYFLGVGYYVSKRLR